MKKISLLALILFINQAQAGIHVSAEKHMGGRYVTKITSLTLDESEGITLKNADPNLGYEVEVEREVEGFVGPVVGKDLFQSKVKVGLGVEFTSGLSFINSKKVKNKAEIEPFLKNKAIDYFSASKALKMEKDEKAHFGFFAGLVLAPHVSHVGIWAVASGGWDVEITKEDEDVVNVEFSLVSAKLASFYFDKLGLLASADLGRELEDGYELKLNLKNPKAREAYERLFKGNVLFAQQESLTTKDILFKKQTKEKTVMKGTGFKARTPVIAWFIFANSNHLVSGEKVNLELEEQKNEKELKASYEEEATVDFLKTYKGRTRIFSAKYNTENHEFKLSDRFELESNFAPDLGSSLNSMAIKTQDMDFYKVQIPSLENKYFKTKFEVDYTEDFMKHLMSEKVDYDLLLKEANKKLNRFYDAVIAKRYAMKMDASSMLQERQYSGQLIYIGLDHLKKDAANMKMSLAENNVQGALNSYALMMKKIYKSPFLYKSLVDYSLRCGTEVKKVIETEAFAKKESIIHSKKSKSCTF